MALGNVFTGVRALVLINSSPVGFCSGVSGSESYDREPIDVLDLLEVREYALVAYRSTVSAQIFRVIGKSLKALGIFPTEENALTAADLTIAVQDTATGNTAAKFEECAATEASWDVTARGITSNNVSFVTKRMRDESENPLT